MKQLSRRDLLRFGPAALLAWPILSSTRVSAQTATPKKRFLTVFSSSGVRQDMFWPNGSVGDFSSGSYNVDGRTMEGLKPYLADIIIPRGVRNNRGGGDSHDAGSVAILTGSPLTNSTAPAFGISLDQHMAKTIGTETPEPYLLTGVRLEVERISKYISFDEGGFPVDYIQDPYTVYDRIFKSRFSGCDGAAPTSTSIDTLKFKRKSILDAVLAETQSLKNAYGMDAFEQQKLERMSDAIRSIENRLEGGEVVIGGDTAHCEAVTGALDATPAVQNSDVNFPALLKLHFDLIALAFELDITRIATISLSLGGSGGAPMNWLNWTDAGGNSHPIEASHHNVTHGAERGVEDYVPKNIVIDRWNFDQFAYLIGELKNISEGENTLLDNSIVWYASDVGQGDVHDDNNVPFIVAGKAGGALKTGRYVDFGGVNHQSFLVSFAQLMGFPEITSWGQEGASSAGAVLL